MSILYVISAIILAVIMATITIVIINGIDHNKRINLNWLVLMVAIALGCSLVMVTIYHNQHDIPASAVQNAYGQGVEDGKTSASHTIPSNEEMENWFSSTQEVIVGTNEGGDVAVHIIDGDGEEWVLFADTIMEK